MKMRSLLSEYLGSDGAAVAYRRRTDALERLRSRGTPAPLSYSFDVQRWRARAGATDTPPNRPKCRERFVETMQKYKSEMLDLIAPEIGEIAAEVVQAALRRERNVNV